MEGDRRSFRVAIMADRYVNPPPGGLDCLAVAAEAGWGVLMLPADDYPAEITEPILAEVVEHAEEFSRRGYDIVLVGEDETLGPALERVGVVSPDKIVPSNAGELLEFLARRPAPQASFLLAREDEIQI